MNRDWFAAVASNTHGTKLLHPRPLSPAAGMRTVVIGGLAKGSLSKNYTFGEQGPIARLRAVRLSNLVAPPSDLVEPRGGVEYPTAISPRLTFFGQQYARRPNLSEPHPLGGRPQGDGARSSDRGGFRSSGEMAR